MPESKSTTGSKVGAEALYSWFEVMDEHAEQRAELLAAKVPAHTAAALYPLEDFGFIAAQLAVRVNAINIRTLAAKKPFTLRRRRQELLELLDALPVEFEEARAREIDVSVYQAQAQPLTDALTNQFGSRQLGQVARSTCCSMLWHVWWLTGHRAELPAEQRRQLDTIARWLSENVLKLA